jgi:predicted nucleic acid-binding protein
VRKLWAGASEIFTVELANVEVRSAITRRLDGRDLERARRRFAELRLELLWVQIDQVLIEDAGDLVEAHRLRALDALHLAGALALRDSSVVVATWDAALARAAEDAGLALAT